MWICAIHSRSDGAKIRVWEGFPTLKGVGGTNALVKGLFGCCSFEILWLQRRCSGEDKKACKTMV